MGRGAWRRELETLPGPVACGSWPGQPRTTGTAHFAGGRHWPHDLAAPTLPRSPGAPPWLGHQIDKLLPFVGQWVQSRRARRGDFHARVTSYSRGGEVDFRKPLAVMRNESRFPLDESPRR